MPARAPYAAAATPALPAVGSTNRSAPAGTARVIAALSPRALNEPVGLVPSSLIQRSAQPEPRAGAWRPQERGVALAEGDRLFARERAAGTPEPPHPVPPARARHGRRRSGTPRGVAHQPRVPARRRRSGSPSGPRWHRRRSTRGSSPGPCRRDHVVCRFRCDEHPLGAAGAEKPGTAASSATDARPHAGQAAEALQQPAPPLRPDTRNVRAAPR